MSKVLPPDQIANISIINLVGEILSEAIRAKASDIHIDPTEKELKVRLRVDGILNDALFLPKELSLSVISRLKVLAHLRTDEHQRPQDGRFHFPMDNLSVDVRLSIMPTYYGENAVLRLLIQREDHHSLGHLGFSTANTALFESILKKSTGMVLISGPTGSGKTTTLYNLLSMINSQERAIVTIEDPIEYAISGVEQIQVNDHSNLSFANGLRAILRQDPDIIMVGEIRDKETARIAINSALTGHLLFSTLHTPDALRSLIRLFDLGIEPYLVAATLSLVAAQRLVRKICSRCKEEKKVQKDGSTVVTYAGRGCRSCEESGYEGRVAIGEVVTVDKQLGEMIAEQLPVTEIEKIVKKNGFISMAEDGWQKVLSGETSFSELLRVTND